MTPMERMLVITTKWTGAGLVASLPLLLADVRGSPDDLTVPFLVHLSVLVAFGLVLTWSLIPYASDEWYVDTGWSRRTRLAISGAGAVALSTGAVALVTLASSAALRYDPSTQFLQLLSALDIAWAGAAIMVGAVRVWGRSAAVASGVALGVFCVWSIWNYVNHVGFGPGGEWIVSGPDMMTRVIPYDMVAAIVAIILFSVGVRVAGRQPTRQPMPQS